MAKRYEEDKSGIESNTVGVYRTAATVKGGRRFSFSGMVVCGDRKGRVGLGYGKANQVPNAIEKAQKKAKQAMRKLSAYRYDDSSSSHRTFWCVHRTACSSITRYRCYCWCCSACCTGLGGVQDCLSKAYGSTNNKNLTKAVIDGLQQLRSREQVESLRKIKIEKTHIEEAHDTLPEPVSAEVVVEVSE